MFFPHLLLQVLRLPKHSFPTSFRQLLLRLRLTRHRGNLHCLAALALPPVRPQAAPLGTCADRQLSFPARALRRLWPAHFAALSAHRVNVGRLGGPAGHPIWADVLVSGLSGLGRPVYRGLGH